MAAVDLESYKDLDRAIDQLLQCKPLSEAEVKDLCAKAQNVFVNENNVQPVAAPVTVRLAAGGGGLPSPPPPPPLAGRVCCRLLQAAVRSCWVWRGNVASDASQRAAARCSS